MTKNHEQKLEKATKINEQKLDKEKVTKMNQKKLEKEKVTKNLPQKICILFVVVELVSEGGLLEIVPVKSI